MSTIVIDLKYFTDAKTSCEVVFVPLDTPWFDGNSIVVTRRRSVRTGSNGLASIVLLVGSYTMSFIGLGDENTDSFTVVVPDDNNTYQVVDRIGATPTPPTPRLSSFVANNGAAFGLIGLAGGGATKLDGVVTVGIGSLLVWVDDSVYDYGLWEKVSSTHATDIANGWMRPLDYNSLTNPVAWRQKR